LPQSDQIIQDLHDVLEDDDGLADRVEQSLRQARERAAGDLDPVLFEALEWPGDLAEYDDYLRRFIRWIPRQTDAPAWKTSAPHERYAKEVSDRLAQFFWLLDQQVDAETVCLAHDSAPLRGWLTEFARQWGSFLDTPESFSQEILESFVENAPEYTVGESLVAGRPNAPSGWRTFNQFFARELNPGLRPIADPWDNHTLTSPADCLFQQSFAIDEESNIPAKTIKHTHRYGNIRQLMEGSRYAEAFAGGTFVHYMLPPSSYHRYHVPVAGRVEESFVVSGKVYMQVDLEDGQLASRDAAGSGFEFTQVRGVLTIDTGASGLGDLGVVAVIPVGMSHVASVTLTTMTGTEVAKGEEFGFFQFGGSDIIILLQAGVTARIDTDAELRKVGAPIDTLAW
jgi:phosphatidylserine decarboxylase precursor